MASVPLRQRVVEVIADLGKTSRPRWRYGSGLLIGDRQVLTAAHVVAGAVAVTVRGPDKVAHPADLDMALVGDPDRLDLALLAVPDAPALPNVDVALVDRDVTTGEVIEGCWAVGYPSFQEVARDAAGSSVRETAQVLGRIPPLSGLVGDLLSLQVTARLQPLPAEQTRLGQSEWSGMSGAAVLAGEALVGVVTEHAPRRGSSEVTVIPLDRLMKPATAPADAADWWARLGVRGLADLQRLPAPPPERPEPAYWETVRQFGRTLHQRMPQLLGREQDLAEIAGFATGPAGYRWLVGGAYAGKTALLYEAVTAGLPDEVDVVCYFLSRRASDADSSRFLAAVVPQLAYLCELDPPVADRDQFYALWAKATERAAEVGRQLLLVVDGLDEDIRPPGLPSVASLLPTLVEGRAHVLVTSRPHPELPVDVPDGHPLTRPSIRVDLTPFEGAEKLAELARQEIYSLTHGADSDTAVDVLGILTAAAGPLSVRDLAILSSDLAPPSAAHRRRVRRLVTEQAARSLEPVGLTEQPRYQFAHFSLLEYAQATEELTDPEYRKRIYQWAERWRDRGWPTSPDITESTPRYLLDSYPGTLASEPRRLVALVCDAGWVDAAIQLVGADRVLADLQRAAVIDAAEPAVGAMIAIVSGQAHHLRPSLPVTQPGYVLRQLWMQAAELGEDRLASDLRARLRSQPDLVLIPIWTTRRASRALLAELGRHDASVRAVAVLPDGRVVSGGGRRVLVWDPAQPGSDPVELGRHHEDWVAALAVLPDGRVVSGGGRVLVWDPAEPESGPAQLGRHDDWVDALAVLPDGRVVTGGRDRRVLTLNATTQRQVAQLGCSVVGLAAVQASGGEAFLVVVHAGKGFSVWSIAREDDEPFWESELNT